jgi:hypothetical protein
MRHDLNDSSAIPRPSRSRRALTEADAVDLWIARWLRVRRKDLVLRYDCDPRRIYEVWEGARFPAAREKAWDAFAQRFPGLADRVDSGFHRRIPRSADPDQLNLFEGPAMRQPQSRPDENKTRT